MEALENRTGGSSGLCSRRFNRGPIASECNIRGLEPWLPADKLRKSTLVTHRGLRVRKRERNKHPWKGKRRKEVKLETETKQTLKKHSQGAGEMAQQLRALLLLRIQFQALIQWLIRA